MSLRPREIQWGKHCLVYCGPGRCDCGASAGPQAWLEHELELERQARAAQAIDLAEGGDDTG